MNLELQASISELFKNSSLQLDGPFGNLNEVHEWLNSVKQRTKVEVEKISLHDIDHWRYEPERGIIEHVSGKFFSIKGFRAHSNTEKFNKREQPLIHQPEVGYLGFIVQEFEGVLHFLVQAKVEPGNSNHFQLSPTLQATRSNYTQVHKGKVPPYLDYFQQANPKAVIFDQLLSEQGSRFYRKYNRNMIIRVDSPIEVRANFRWMTLGQLKVLMGEDCMVNMDTRSVLSGVPLFKESCYGNGIARSTKCARASIHTSTSSEHSFVNDDTIISQYESLKSADSLELETVPLSSLEDWKFESSGVISATDASFRIIAIQAILEGREVHSWSQPMLESTSKGLCAFICKRIKGVLHFALQFKMEFGSGGIYQFSPTVQSLEVMHKKGKALQYPEKFQTYIENASNEQVLYDAILSEEGGRFYHDDNRYCIVEAGLDFSDELPENYVWMTLNQMSGFLRAGYPFNIQARSLLAVVNFT